MTLSVRTLRRAISDLQEIRRYIERDRPDAPRRLVARLLVVAESLVENPERGAQPRDERLRELGYRFVPVRPYLLFYKVGRRVVRVYRVLHGQRRYEDVL